MKTVLNVRLLGLIVALCLVITVSEGHFSFRSRPRSTRGFKNAALSTARGFGKRDGPFPSSNFIVEQPFDAKKDGEYLMKGISSPER